MALLFFDGFDTFRNTNGAIDASFGTKYSTENTNQNIDVGRVSGKCVKILFPDHRFTTPGLTTDNTLIVGFALKYEGTSFIKNVLMLLEGSNLGFNLQLNPAGEFILRRGTTTIQTTSGAALYQNVWYYVELKVVTHATSGAYELRLNGDTIAIASGVNTKATGLTNDYHDKVKFETNQTYNYYDDMYILDSTGTTNNNFLGSQKVIAIFPSAVGNSNDFTPSAGAAHYSLVNERPPDNDTTFIESGTVAHKDTFGYDDAVAIADIKGIQINTTAKLSDASPFNLTHVIRSNSTDYDLTSSGVAGDYTNKYDVIELDPDDSMQWTTTKINAAEFGVKVG